ARGLEAPLDVRPWVVPSQPRSGCWTQYRPSTLSNVWFSWSMTTTWSIGITVNESGVVQELACVATVIGPEVAPAGTLATTDWPPVTVNGALVPSNCTSVTPPSPDPVIVTAVPTAPACGEKPSMPAPPARAA